MSFSEQEVQRTPCNIGIAQLTFKQGVTRTETVTLHDDNGDLLYVPEDCTVSFIGKTTFNTEKVEWTLDATVDDNDSSKVSITISPDDVTKEPGLYSAGFVITDENDAVYDVVEYYVTINPTILSKARPTTVAEIRMDLRDTCPAVNRLIDELEFTDAEIVHSIQAAIEVFNSTPPLVANYNPVSFPWPDRLKDCAVGHLMMMASRLYLRNHLAYNAGGLSVDDQNKFREYEAAGEKLLKEFETWAQQIKVSINVQNCYGRLRSRYY